MRPGRAVKGAAGPITDCGVGRRHQAHGLIDMEETALRRGYRSRAVGIGAVERGPTKERGVEVGKPVARSQNGPVASLSSYYIGRVKPPCPGPFGGQVPHAGGGSQWDGF